MGYILIDRELGATFKLSAKHQKGAFREALKRLGYAVKVQIENVDELTLYRVVEGSTGFDIFVYALHDYDAERYAEDVMGLRTGFVTEVRSEAIEEQRALGWPGESFSAYPTVVAIENNEPVLLRA